MDVWKRCVLIFFAFLAASPYILTCTKTIEPTESENWTKLGLILGIVDVFVSFTALPMNPYEIETIDFVAMNIFDYRDAYSVFESIANKHPILSGLEQNRMLLTSPQSILYPLYFCVIMHLLEARKQRQALTGTISIVVMFVGIILLDPRITYPVLVGATVLCCIIALVLECISCMRRKQESPHQFDRGIQKRQGLLVHGLLLLIFFSNVIIMAVLDVQDKYQRGGLFSDYEKVITLLFVLGTACVLYPNGMRRKKRDLSGARKLLPLYILIYVGFIINYFADIIINMAEFATNIMGGFIVPSYSRYYFFFGLVDCWFPTCISCMIYAVFFLYDYGMKQKPTLYFVITAILIMLTYTPEYKLFADSNFSTVSAANILVGLFTPLLFIAFGILEKRKAKAAGFAKE